MPTFNIGEASSLTHCFSPTQFFGRGHSVRIFFPHARVKLSGHNFSLDVPLHQAHKWSVCTFATLVPRASGRTQSSAAFRRMAASGKFMVGPALAGVWRRCPCHPERPSRLLRRASYGGIRIAPSRWRSRGASRACTWTTQACQADTAPSASRLLDQDPRQEQNVEQRVAGRGDHDEETPEEPSVQLLTRPTDCAVQCERAAHRRRA